jgi:soluble lytic murein transglycosylase-like protein
MLITRITRGAARVSLLGRHKLNQYRIHVPVNAGRIARGLLLTTLVLQTVARPVVLMAPTTAFAAGPDLSDPSPRVVRVSLEAQNALQITRTDEPTLTISTTTLQPVQIGVSEVDAQAAADAAAKIAAAEKAAADAAAALEAAKQAQAAASLKVSVASYGDGEVQDIIRAAAALYNVDANLLLSIAKCESGFNPASKNAHSAASGLFQFMPSTYANSPSARAGLSIWDAQANAEAAAYKIANGGLNAWAASQHCWGR